MSLFKSIGGKVTEVPNPTNKRKASIEDRLIEAYLRINRDWKLEILNTNINVWRNDFYEQVNLETKEIDFTPDDISKLVFPLIDLEENFFALKGAYIGSLISELIKRKIPTNNNIKVSLDLNGEAFPYLCLGIKEADILEISNVTGLNVAAYAFEEGKCGLYSAKNVIGKDSHIHMGISGTIYLTYFKECSGDEIAYHILNKGYGYITCFDHCDAKEIGTSAAGNAGKILLFSSNGTGTRYDESLESYYEKYPHDNLSSEELRIKKEKHMREFCNFYDSEVINLDYTGELVRPISELVEEIIKTGSSPKHKTLMKLKDLGFINDEKHLYYSRNF